ncbi:MAG: MarR family transcriptional regulator [Oscillospiraceae bacterium]|nr:MarR family transcriptional regulator [Oscillospiraceae bacterium]
MDCEEHYSLHGMPPIPPDFDSNSLSAQLLVEINTLRAAWIRLKPHVDLNKSQFSLLLTLHFMILHQNLPGISVGELARKLGQATPSITQKLNVLFDKGYIERSQNEKDRRITYISITQSGSQILKDSHDQFKEMLENLTEKMGEKNIKELIILLKQLTSTVKEISNEREP